MRTRSAPMHGEDAARDPAARRGTTASADELRRRLYRPGASPADLDAYRAAVAAEEAAAPAPVPSPPVRAPRRRGVAAVAVLGGAAVLCAVAALTWTTARAPSAPSASSGVGVDTGVRGLPVTAPLQAVRGDAAERAAFIRALVDGGPAGLGLWLDGRAPDLPGVLATATRSETIEFAGDGDRTVRLSPVSLGDDGGHVTVILVAAVDARGGFSAARPVRDAGRIVHLSSTAPRAGDLRAGIPVTAGFQYLPGERPTTLRVMLPDGVRWGAAVVFSD